MASDAGQTRAQAQLETVLALKTLRAFRDVLPEDLVALAARGRMRALQKGERLCEDPGAARRAGFLCGGRVAAGRGESRREVAAGDWLFGVECLADRGQDEAVALEPSRILEVERSALLDLLEAEFELFVSIGAVVARTAIGMLRSLMPRQHAAPAPGPPLDVGRFGLADKLRAFRERSPLGAESVYTLGRLARAAEGVGFERAEQLWRAEDPADSILLVLSGVLESRDPRTGDTVFQGPGSLVGALECLAGETQGLDVATHTPVEVLRIERGVLLDILEDVPEVASQGLVRLSKAIDEISRAHGLPRIDPGRPGRSTAG